jgi:hypothetical protein
VATATVSGRQVRRGEVVKGGHVLVRLLDLEVDLVFNSLHIVWDFDRHEFGFGFLLYAAPHVVVAQRWDIIEVVFVAQLLGAACRCSE